MSCLPPLAADDSSNVIGPCRDLSRRASHFYVRTNYVRIHYHPDWYNQYTGHILVPKIFVHFSCTAGQKGLPPNYIIYIRLITKEKR